MRLYLYQQRHFLKFLIQTNDNAIEDQILLPSMSLKKTLLEIKKNHNIEDLEEVFLCTQFGQYVIEQNIGSKPVFVTTQGFESSVDVHRPVEQDNFTLHPKRTSSLLNSDYIFGVDEEVSPDGKTLSSIDENQLDVITAKLKLSEKQNIAIGLLNSRYNNEHEDLLTQYFKDQDYRCFSFNHQSHQDYQNENFRWWQTILNAYMYPPFEDFLETVKEVFHINNDQLHILHADSYKKFGENNHFLDSALSYIHLVKNQFEDQSVLLFLDTEDFLFIEPNKTLNCWTTPVAKAYCKHPYVKKSNIQPTQYILQDAWGCLNFGYETLSYEPGPMLMGKGLKLCFVDLLFYKGLLKKSILQKFSQIGSLQKIDELLMAYSKKTGLSPKELADELIQLFVFQIKNHLLEYKTKSILVTGDLAEDLIPVFNEYLKEYKFKYIEHTPLNLMQKG